jgi:hypothetical protein
MSRITLAQLDREIDEVSSRVDEAWDQGNLAAWTLLSSWLAGSRTRRWLMQRGWIR